MINKEDLIFILEYSKELEKGVDPTTHLKFAEDTILNNPAILYYNSLVKELALTLLKNKVDYYYPLKVIYKRIPLYVTDEMIKGFEFSKKPISISMITNRINILLPEEMVKVRAQKLTEELVNRGYLTIKSFDGEVIKVPTEIGVHNGIRLEIRKNEYGRTYSVNLYSDRAQKLILDIVVELYGN